MSTGEYLWVDFEGPSMTGNQGGDSYEYRGHTRGVDVSTGECRGSIPRGQMRPNVSDYSGQGSLLQRMNVGSRPFSSNPLVAPPLLL